MPKQTYKILQFHGGLNSSSDPRDIAENELSDAQDIMVDELGKVRMMGGSAAHGDAPANVAAITPGYGLFQFSHDRTGAELKTLHEGTHTGGDSATVLIDSAAAFTSGLVGGTVYNITDGSTGTVVSVDSGIQITVDDLTGGTSDTFDDSDNDAYAISWPETGDDYLAIADADGAADIDIYSRVADAWGTAKIDLGDTTGMKAAFYAADGALRVSDGNFGGANRVQWYGYINRYFFGDGSTGIDVFGHTNGVQVSKWYSANAAPTAITATAGGLATVYPDAAEPLHVNWYGLYNYKHAGYPGTEGLKSTDESFLAIVDFSGANETITFKASGDSVTNPGIDNFCSVGDVLLFLDAVDANNNSTFEILSIDAGDPNIITVDQGDHGYGLTVETGDTVVIHNLSRQGWFDPDKRGWQIAVSTLYDDSKQESPLSVVSTIIDPEDVCHVAAPTLHRGMSKMIFKFLAFCGDGASTGLPQSDPRISGFNIYMRRESGGTWYQQANVDISKGIKLANESTFVMWASSGLGSGDNQNAYCDETNPLFAPLEIITYEDSSGRSGSDDSSPFSGSGTGFKTAVIANRRAYVGNFKAKDSQGNVQVYGDAIMKSQVGKFDSFSVDRRLEAEISDGDAIVKLEEYADRLLQFKKKKMTLINISQEVEFIEETFMHKGVSHPAAVCKTDFGIAWVNRQGCYLYDGQKVSNLLEKGGRQIIKEGDWFTFVTQETAPMIGYLSKKRQLIVVDGSTDGEPGSIYLYDLVTQSWVEGHGKMVADAARTNLITDWNGDLIFAHTTDQGTVVKWDDAADASAFVDIKTKDIDFGEPAVRKKIYKVYITYRGNATNVQVHYGVNGLAPTLTFNTINSDGSSTGSGSLAKCMPVNADVDDWLKAELKPSASINNINSFRLKLSGDGSNAIAADFEINDISIVYRGKNVK